MITIFGKTKANFSVQNPKRWLGTPYLKSGVRLNPAVLAESSAAFSYGWRQADWLVGSSREDDHAKAPDPRSESVTKSSYALVTSLHRFYNNNLKHIPVIYYSPYAGQNQLEKQG